MDERTGERSILSDSVYTKATGETMTDLDQMTAMLGKIDKEVIVQPFDNEDIIELSFWTDFHQIWMNFDKKGNIKGAGSFVYQDGRTSHPK